MAVFLRNNTIIIIVTTAMFTTLLVVIMIMFPILTITMSITTLTHTSVML